MSGRANWPRHNGNMANAGARWRGNIAIRELVNATTWRLQEFVNRQRDNMATMGARQHDNMATAGSIDRSMTFRDGPRHESTHESTHESDMSFDRRRVDRPTGGIASRCGLAHSQWTGSPRLDHRQPPCGEGAPTQGRSTVPHMRSQRAARTSVPWTALASMSSLHRKTASRPLVAQAAPSCESQAC